MTSQTHLTADDEFEIRRLIENWALWRDAGEWEKFATVWHPDGLMSTTWSQTSAVDFIARSRRAFEGGLKVLHMLGGSTIEVNGSRAVAQTKMQIIQRAPVHDVLVDVVCHGRFWDAFEKRDGRWGMMQRQPIYELDHMTPVDPSATLTLDPELLAKYPEGYRHLAYLQTQIGMQVSLGLPGTRGPEIAALIACGKRWLAGENVVCVHGGPANIV